MRDAARVDSALSKLLAIERGTRGGESECAPKARFLHCCYRRSGQRAQQTHGALRIGAQRDAFKYFYELRQHVLGWGTSNAIWSAAADELFQKLDGEIDLFSGDVEAR